MSDRYDWVILGGTPEGRQAAARAARSPLRVALVEPPDRHAAMTAHVTAQTFLAWVNRPGGSVAKIAGADGHRPNSQAELSQTELSQAELSQTELSQAELFQTELFQTELFQAELSQTELSQTELSQAELSQAELFQADLALVDLKARVCAHTGATFGDEGLSRLAMLGVDVIPEAIAAIQAPIAPRFPTRRRSPLSIQTTTRHLEADHLLLATGSQPAAPDWLGAQILGLNQVPYWTPAQLITSDRPWPQRWVVLSAESQEIGDASLALAWAQVLARCGRSVRLMLPHPHPLPQFERTLNGWAIAQLEAEGIRIDVASLDLDERAGDGDERDRHAGEDRNTALTDPDYPGAGPVKFEIPPQQVQQMGETIWVQTGGQPLETDALLVVGGDRPWCPSDLGPLLQLPPAARSLPLTPHLRTCHPQIYACGSVLGGSPDPALAQREAAIAIAQTSTPARPLWRSRHHSPARPTLNYAHHPIAVPLDPPLARVGLSQPQAIAHFGAAAVRHHRIQQGGRALHLVTHQTGQLLGVAAAGAGAIAWIACVATVVQRGGTVDEVRSLPLATGWPNPEGDWAAAIAWQNLWQNL